jgi:hypothetical protein
MFLPSSFIRESAVLVTALSLVALPACTQETKSDRIDKALGAAAGYLLDRQSPDGTWRSATYGTFKEGDALTPLVVEALLRTPLSERREAGTRRGAEYLASMAHPDGTIEGLTYPVHTAATAAVVLDNWKKPWASSAKDDWLEFLRRQQLIEPLGWQPGDRQYGGWSYAKELPWKPAAGLPIPTLTEPNLSATRAAVEALRGLDTSPSDPALVKARQFIMRCQNFGGDAPVFDDGGFFFIQGDPVRNKAGVAGTDRQGNQRYFSYGSTTADGLRAMLATGFGQDDPRVRAARTWLETQFRPDMHVGKYAADREAARPSLYYYYGSSIARAFRASGTGDLLQGARHVHWARELAENVLSKQRPDGSWINSAVDVREDDPFVATSLAIQILAVCRDCLGPD